MHTCVRKLCAIPTHLFEYVHTCKKLQLQALNNVQVCTRQCFFSIISWLYLLSLSGCKSCWLNAGLLLTTGLQGHSYGTFHCSRFVQMYPEMVQSLCLMDPVNFNMFSGELQDAGIGASCPRTYACLLCALTSHAMLQPDQRTAACNSFSQKRLSMTLNAWLLRQRLQNVAAMLANMHCRDSLRVYVF